MNNSALSAFQIRAAIFNRFVLSAVILAAAASSACAQQNRWTDVSRVVAVSDPHGAYDAFVATLNNAGLIDDGQQWSGGESHLVITGDLLDRGADSRKVMDLVMSLETQAFESGGMVHLTLGNHEVMNLVGDLRYVAVGEYAAFAADETSEEREEWFARYGRIREPEDSQTIRSEFDERHPPGFFAHRRAFSSKGKYGSWLLQKPVMVVLNDTVFVHGGLSPLVAEFDLDTLNATLTSQVADYVVQLEVLVDSGLIEPGLNFYDHHDAASALLSNADLPADQATAAQAIVDLADGSIHGQQSPLWYRGSVGCSSVVENDTLNSALSAVGANRVVIGHTPTYTRRVLSRHNGRVFEIDTGMLSAAYRGSGHALIIEGAKLSVVSEAGELPAEPVPHPRRVGLRPTGMSFSQLEQGLLQGAVASRSKGSGGKDVIKLTVGDQAIDALFIENPRNRDTAPALAAYRLDRMLGLDMVPLTVARDIDGKRGAIQYKPPQTLNEGERAGSGQGGDAWCSLRQQWNAMYIFDSLIHNEGRPPEDMLYSPDNWQLILAGNVKTFSSDRGKPRYLDAAPLELGQSWLAALESLTDDRLQSELGDVLDKRRMTGLLKRRDLLIREARQ